MARGRLQRYISNSISLVAPIHNLVLKRSELPVKPLYLERRLSIELRSERNARAKVHQDDANGCAGPCGIQ
jgi:hypothetical protein